MLAGLTTGLTLCCTYVHVATCLCTDVYGTAWPWVRACCCQWPRGLRRRFAAFRLLELRVRILAGACISFSCECLCCQVEVSATGRSLIQRSPTESGVSECDCEASKMMAPFPTKGCCATGGKKFAGLHPWKNFLFPLSVLKEEASSTSQSQEFLPNDTVLRSLAWQTA
jgi:hypothetical protein